MSMDLINLINDMSFEYEKEEKALKDIAEEYGENVNGAMADWRFNKDGERFARRFESIED
jgi:hypothetical protein